MGLKNNTQSLPSSRFSAPVQAESFPLSGQKMPWGAEPGLLEGGRARQPGPPRPGLPVSSEYLPLPCSPCTPPAPAHTPCVASLAPEPQHDAALYVAMRHIAHPPLHSAAVAACPAAPLLGRPEPVCAVSGCCAASPQCHVLPHAATVAESR